MFYRKKKKWKKKPFNEFTEYRGKTGEHFPKHLSGGWNIMLIVRPAIIYNFIIVYHAIRTFIYFIAYHNLNETGDWTGLCGTGRINRPRTFKYFNYSGIFFNFFFSFIIKKYTTIFLFFYHIHPALESERGGAPINLFFFTVPLANYLCMEGKPVRHFVKKKAQVLSTRIRCKYGFFLAFIISVVNR